jgi:hypothetical protein
VSDWYIYIKVWLTVEAEIVASAVLLFWCSDEVTLVMNILLPHAYNVNVLFAQG